MNRHTRFALLLAGIGSLFAIGPDAAFAGTPIADTGSSGAPLSDLTLSNFFSEGWSDSYAKRVDPNGAPDMSLLRVQTNFLEREFRLDTYEEQNANSASKKDVEFLSGLIAYSLNRRFMLEIVSSYEWIGSRVNHDVSGADVAAVARFQLVDVPGSSYALNIRATAPNDTIGEKQTDLSFSLAGWNDLTKLGLNRTGIYYHVQEETYLGSGDPGTTRNDFTYGVSIAKTWTPADLSFFGNFTTFVEGFGETDVDGSSKGHTAITVTPGIRFSLGRAGILMAGVDIPVSNPESFGTLYRLTYILNF